MSPLMECEAEASVEFKPTESRLDGFLKSVTMARESALLLDFDGTLAPFRVDPSRVKPWVGITRLLSDIQETSRTRLAIVSGRPARDVASQLAMSRPPEIWGLHGAERLWPDGRIEIEELPVRQQAALNAARNALRETGLIGQLGLRLEEKTNAVVVHWRGKPAHSAHVSQERVATVLRPFAEDAEVEMLLFDGGVELRSGRDKGDVVRLLLEELDPDEPVAYLGDDTTDENAFEALADRGLSILVRRQWRPTTAQLWLRPPDQLRTFLSAWLAAVRG
jgi:trehalose 6-phosphate phosphatase